MSDTCDGDASGSAAGCTKRGPWHVAPAPSRATSAEAFRRVTKALFIAASIVNFSWVPVLFLPAGRKNWFEIRQFTVYYERRRPKVEIPADNWHQGQNENLK